MRQTTKGRTYGSSIAAVLACLVGPRIALAPPDEGGTGGGSADEGGGAAPAGEAAKPAAEGEGAPSALAAGVAKAAEAAAEPKPGATEGKVEGPDKVKPEGEPKAETKPKDGEPPADAVVKDVDGNPLPEKYDVKMADGVEMDAKLYEQAAPIFKEHKMSPAQAQAMTDLYSKVQGDAIAKHAEMVAGWADEAKKDPEIGGPQYDENIGKASAAFQAFGSPRLLEIFDAWGLGNNPEVLRCFARVGKAMGEGATILPGSGTGRVSDAQALYPSMNK